MLFIDPNLAFALLIIGAAAVLWELHAPGLFVPGVIGIALLGAGALGLYRDGSSWYGAILLAAALVLLAVELKLYSHGLSGLAGAVLLAWGALELVPGAGGIHPSVAIAAALSAAIISIFLGWLGVRARRLQPLTGAERLVGEHGLARTAIAPEGTVLVRGEYWQAHSLESIPADAPIIVERIDNLLLRVRQA